MTTKIGAAWRALRDELAEAGIETASLDARLLAQTVLDCDAIRLAMRENDDMPDEALVQLGALGQRRLAREPIARILGQKSFFGMEFVLGADTLVPRPETELLVELALDAFDGAPPPRILDLGTGTGCIVISLLANLPGASAVATDVSPGALDTARVNAAVLGVADRIDFRQGDWFGALGADEQFDLIVSNPPYIRHEDIAGLDIDVKDHDPMLALDGGGDGFTPYRVIAGAARCHMHLGARLMVEHGTGQSGEIAALFAKAGFSDISSHKDLGGHDRVILATS